MRCSSPTVAAFFFSLLPFLPFAPAVAENQATKPGPLTNKDIVDLTTAQVPSSVILVMIRSSDTHFNVSPEEVVALKEAGVSEQVLAQMIRATPNGDRSKRHPWSIVFGVGVAGVYADSIGEADYVPTKDRRSVRPAFVTSALRLNEDSRWSHGPMLVTDVEIGKDGAAVSLRSIGVGYMVSARQLSGDRSNANARVNGFGLGLAYILDQRIALQHRLDAQQIREVSGHAVAVVLLYNFGKPADQNR